MISLEHQVLDILCGSVEEGIGLGLRFFIVVAVAFCGSASIILPSC
jgi:hypothetical protein